MRTCLAPLWPSHDRRVTTTDAQRIVARNRHVVLALPMGGQAEMAAGLSGHLVAEVSESACEVLACQTRGSLTGR